MNGTEHSSLSSYNKLRPNPHVIVQRMGDDVVLLHLHTNRFYELNGTAARLWELFSAGNTVHEVHAHMLQEFDVDAASLADEIATTLAVMQRAELVDTYA